MSLLITGFHSSICLSAPLFKIMATSWCWTSFRSEYKIVSSVDALIFSVPVHLLSLTLKIGSFCFLISAVICANLSVSNIVLTFQIPIQVFTLVLKTSLHVSGFFADFTTARHKSLQRRIWESIEDMCKRFSCCCFCNDFFSRKKLLALCQTPNLEGQELYLSWLLFIHLTGMGDPDNSKAPAGLALKVLKAHKQPNHEKVAVHQVDPQIGLVEVWKYASIDVC